MAKKIVSDLNVKGKKVLIRVDFNVPMKNGVITDDTRVRAALPTIQYVVANGGKAIVFSHLGRVKSVEDIAKNNIKPVAERLEQLIGKKLAMITNLKPAKLCGIVSEGMIICAENDEGKLAFLTPEKDIEDGSQVF